MALHRRGGSSYRGVRTRPSAMFYADIRSGDTCLGLGTSETAQEAARAYDAMTWRLARPRSQMNFLEVRSREEALARIPLTRLITAEYRCIHQRWERRLLIAQTDEQVMKVWRQRFRWYVLDECEFWARRRAVRADRRERKAAAVPQWDLGHASTWSSDDDRWHNVFLTTKYTTKESEE
ncbi:Ethylene-responsive transcription factor 6 [Hordeum vulgare]|nr:Ethylene-responsive transcription factor 6 [Hordeum vulgare]